MGWTWTHKEQGESIFDFFSSRWNDEEKREDGSVILRKVLDCAVVRLKTAYLAYEIISPNRREVVACVCLLGYSKDYYNFGFKDMDENMGLFNYDCPERILNLLTPTSNGLANKWRYRCREMLEKKKSAPKLQVGDVLEFAQPVRFTNGSVTRHLAVMALRPLRFKIAQPAKNGGFKTSYGRFRLNRQSIEPGCFTVVGRVKEA